MGDNRKIIYNCRAFDGESIIDDAYICIKNGFVDSISDRCEERSSEIIDAKGMLVAPGFIDLQINGGGGVLFNDSPDTKTLDIIKRAHERHGVLHFLITLITTDISTTLKAVDAVKEYRNTDDGVLGIHLEGPYIEKTKPGIHDVSHIRRCTTEELSKIYDICPGVIKLVTAAPETCDISCVRYMTQRGTVVFIGHSDASYLTAQRYFENGVSGCTHLFNAMSQFQGREPGIVGACFDSNEAYAGIIADGFHVDFASVRIAKKNMGQRLFFVSDAMPPSGYGDMDFQIGESRIYCEDKKCVSENGTIAGSAICMDDALKNAVKYCGMDIKEALRMTSTYQANLLGMEGRLGYIKKGSCADFVMLDENIDVKAVMRRGEIERWDT